MFQDGTDKLSPKSVATVGHKWPTLTDREASTTQRRPPKQRRGFAKDSHQAPRPLASQSPRRPTTRTRRPAGDSRPRTDPVYHAFRLRDRIRFNPVAVSRSLNSLFRVLFNFPSRYLSAIGLAAVFSFRWSFPPLEAVYSNNPTLERATRCGQPLSFRAYTLDGQRLNTNSMSDGCISMSRAHTWHPNEQQTAAYNGRGAFRGYTMSWSLFARRY